jgi:hypothetical protein
MTDILDLSNSSSQTLTFTVDRSAAFDNTVDFYAVNADGSVVDQTSGNTIAPGEDGYAEAAIANRLNLDLSTDNGVTSTFTADLTGGVIYAPIIAVNSDFQALTDGDTSNDPQVYFSFVAANVDGFDHVQSDVANQFSFEDLFNGGDKDFNDLIINFELEEIEPEPAPEPPVSEEPEPEPEPELEPEPAPEIQLQVFAPTLDNPISTPITAVLSDDDIEFENVDFFDLGGDPLTVIDNNIDFKIGDGNKGNVSFKIDANETLSSFVSGEFNGYVFTDIGDEIPPISNITIDESTNTLGLEPSDVTFSENTIEVNVESIAFEPGDMVMLNIDFI